MLNEILKNDDAESLTNYICDGSTMEYEGNTIDIEELFKLVCQKNCIHCLQALMVQYSIRDYDYYTFAYEAAKNGQIEVLQFLQSQDISIADAFDGAIAGGKYDILTFLYASAYDDVYLHLFQFNNLIAAVKGGSLDCVKFLLEEWERSNDLDTNEIEKAKSSALIAAINLGNFEIVKFLLEKGSRVNDNAKIIESILKCKDIKLLAMLLQNPMIYSIKLDEGKSWIDLAIDSSNEDLAAFVLANSKNIPQNNVIRFLFKSVSRKLYNLTKFLLSNGVPASATNENKETILHIAASQGDIEMCSIILKFGKNINMNAVDNRKRTAVQRAISAGHAECAKILLKKSK